MQRKPGIVGLVGLLACSLGLVVAASPPPSPMQRSGMPTAVQAEPALDGADIIARAHAAAGGESFVQPGTLFLEGYNIIRGPRGEESLWDRYAMWRVFAGSNTDAHSANGKVRIEAWSEGNLALLLAYDGEVTSDQNGPVENQSANVMWSNNFGFGAIRNALDDGWQQVRRPDDMVDGAPAFFVELTDPSGGTTLFGIRQRDYAILSVGFQTPRGWHERRYSHFFSRPGTDWVQAGRVRLFYDGVKKNEAIWTDFRIGEPMDPALFRIGDPPVAPGW